MSHDEQEEMIKDQCNSLVHMIRAHEAEAHGGRPQPEERLGVLVYLSVMLRQPQAAALIEGKQGRVTPC